jgi:hypothetical protein
VKSQKSGRVRICMLDASGFALLRQWSDDQGSALEKKLDQLGEMLNEPEA